MIETFKPGMVLDHASEGLLGLTGVCISHLLVAGLYNLPLRSIRNCA